MNEIIHIVVSSPATSEEVGIIILAFLSGVLLGLAFSLLVIW